MVAKKKLISRTDDTDDDDVSVRGDQIGVRSVEIAGRLLDTLAALDGPQTLSALAAAASLQPAKAHRYLVSLIRAGLVEQNSRDGRYDFGGAARRIGRVAMNRLDIMRLGAPLLSDLRDQLHATVFMGVWTPRGPVVLECLEVSRPIAIVVRRGALLPLLTSAFGLVCAAHLPNSITAPFVESEIAAWRGTPKPSRSKIEERLRKIRASGFSLVQGELVNGVDAIAVPVLDHRGELAACVAAVGPHGELNVAASGAVVSALQATAHRMSQLLG